MIIFKRYFGPSDEYDDALELRYKVLREPLGLQFSIEDLEKDHTDWLYGAFLDGKIIATLNLRMGDHVKMRQVAVDPEWQGKGIGSQLVRYTEDDLRSQGVEEISLNARVSAISFYRALGYHSIGAEFIEVGIPHLLMKKSLSKLSDVPTQDAVSVQFLRDQFPALSQDLIFMENAGGSQLPQVVIDAMVRYMSTTFVQHGAPYRMSKDATTVSDQAHEWMLRFVNGEGLGQVVLGPSTSVLCQMLADAYRPHLAERPEIIIAETGHESNVGPWVKLQHFGAKIVWWKVDPSSYECSLEELKSLVSEKTLMVALPHVSNLLGQIVDLKQIVTIAHSQGAKVIADGVAYAPHRAIDVADTGVDWYVFSNYKVFGPHNAVLFGRSESFVGLKGPNHFFIPEDSIPYKFELGGVNHEAMAGVVAVQDYFAQLTRSKEVPLQAAEVQEAFRTVEELEQPLTGRLLSYLRSKPGVKIVGPATAGPDRVPTISFTANRSSASVAQALCDAGVGCRNGNMYAYRLCEALGIDPVDGVVRLSLVHTNTLGEVERVIQLLDSIL